MFEATFHDAGILRKVFEAVKEVLSQATLDCTDKGIKLRAMDTSLVAVVNLQLKANCFTTYRCDRDIFMGVCLTSLVKILKCSNNEDAVTLQAGDENDVLTCIFDSKNGDRRSSFNLKLLDIGQQDLVIPECKFACVASMGSFEFAKIIKDMGQFGDTTKICFENGTLTFSSAGVLGTAEIQLGRTALDGDKKKTNTISIRQPVSFLFATRYLMLFCKGTSLSEKVTLSMSADLPLVVQFEIMEAENGSSLMQFFLSPKIEDPE